MDERSGNRKTPARTTANRKRLTSTVTVSVIIPTYNRLSILPRALASVCAQTYKSFELVIIDDGSTDGTAEWLLEKQIGRTILLPENRGGAAARNAGIEIAVGKYVAFLDSDDEWEPEYLQLMVSALEANSAAPMVYSGYVWTYAKGEIWRGVRRSKYVLQVISMLMDYFIDGMSNVVVRREVLDRAGLLDESLRSSHDRELYLRILHLCGDAILVEATPVTRLLSTSSIITSHPDLRAADKLSMLDKFYSLPNTEQYQHLRLLLERILWKEALLSHEWQKAWI